jgi:glutathione synthase/RimK-type ligase-like ATP-grasp enzyme
MKLYPYKMGSKSAKALADALGIKQLKHEGKPLDMRGTTLINWGCSRINREIHGIAPMLNHDEAVAKASNKLETFKALLNEGVSTPTWSTNQADAVEWINEGSAVVCRTKLNGHSGEGIVIAETKGPVG